MTQIGGPAAINGFLYQILHHLDWLASVTLRGKLNDQEVEDAFLVLEPLGGGDAQAEGCDFYLVEQYKTRQVGTWSLSDIVAVLCDLRKSVPTSLPKSAKYRFVTDGRAGKLDTFKSFLADMKLVDGPDKLDNSNKKQFSNNLTLTNREFFEYINKNTESKIPQLNTDVCDVAFHLLSRFEMEFCASGNALAIKIERVLRCYAPDLGDERRVREQLVGVVLEELSTGETWLDYDGINRIFQHVGLSIERLHRLARLPKTMRALTHERLVRLKYKFDRDVRDVLEWPEDKPVLLISGESGVGKTWQLGHLLEVSGREGKIVNLVLNAVDREDMLAQASRDLWQRGLGETSDKTLPAVSLFLRELDPDNSSSRPIIALDDVQDIDLARDLVRQDWADWGMRLILTVPRTVAQSLDMSDSYAVHVHSVDDFSVEELDTLLKKTQRRWADLQSDLKVLLRKPILAGLFLELPYCTVQRAPCSEYEIIDQFWKRIAAKGKQVDEGIVLALAAHVQKGKPYPLLRPTWQEIGLTEEKALERLETTGWLRSTESGEVVFAHDRLLNWAVAKSLVNQFERNELSIEDLSDFLASEGASQDQLVSVQLNYVLMDIMWLLAVDAQNSQTLSMLVARMEDSSYLGSYGETLYVHLLPTLGQRAVPILLERLNEITDESEGDYRIGLIGKAFATLTQQESVTLKETVDTLLKATSRDQQNAALVPLTIKPDVDNLNRLWELHQQRHDALEDKAAVSSHTDYQASFAALRAGILLDLPWLRERILTAEMEKESVSELGYLLNALDHDDASVIWEETRHALMTKVPVSKPRSLLYCIARFKDLENLDFVIKHLSHSKDFASSAALSALSVLDPLAAIERLIEVDETDLYLFRNQWLPVLLRSQPELTRRRIYELTETNPRGFLFIVDIFQDRPDDMDEEMLHFLLNSLEDNLYKHLDEVLVEDPRWLYHPLDFLGRITCPELLAILQAAADGELEKMITEIAYSRLHTNSNIRDSIRENARRVLILMSGKGITSLIKRELESDHYWVRHGGLNWASVRADDGIVEGLVSIASRPILRDADGKIDSIYYQEFHQSTMALAALGEDTALVKVIKYIGLFGLPIDLAQLRAHCGPMSNTLTDFALQTLQEKEASKESLLSALAITWLGGNPDLIPPMRMVLERADPEGLVARHACIALQELGDSSEDFTQLAYCLLKTKANSTWGLEALIWMGYRGLILLESWIMDQGPLEPAANDDLAIRALYENPSTRETGINLAVARCKCGGYFSDSMYDIAAEANEVELRERIFDKAFSTRPIVIQHLLQAIEGVAKFDVTRAMEAIVIGLKSHPKIERGLCLFLVRIAPETAAKMLINMVISTERKSLCRAAGRALRRLDPEVVSDIVVDRMSGLVSERKTIAELAGWVTTPAISEALASLVDHDSSVEVRNAALAALERHRQETNVLSLLAAFPSETSEQRWSLLVAILEAGDPYLLTDPVDSLWLGNIFSEDIPFKYEHHANLVIQQMQEKEDRSSA